MLIRNAEPTDYSFLISVVNDWWGGRHMADMLPKLFLVHFRPTSFVAEHEREIVGFVVGFVSQTFKNEAYIHFVSTHPEFRKRGLGRLLYERFFAAAQTSGRNVIRCVAAPINKASISFHLRMGFSIEPSEKTIDGISFVGDYDGNGADRVLFSKRLDLAESPKHPC
ncbi:MAG: GNAT family N-acetyltransferase [Gammaproteobacteria bacterium]|nr:GNAT family N-acetyltransferase [Gammaproteobacteria bacterium]